MLSASSLISSIFTSGNGLSAISGAAVSVSGNTAFVYCDVRFDTPGQWKIQAYWGPQSGEVGNFNTLTINIPEPCTNPDIKSLAADPASIESGSYSDISWSVEGADSCTASGCWSGAKDPVGGVTRVYPDAGCDYTLTCRKSTCSASKTTSVDVGIVGELAVDAKDATYSSKKLNVLLYWNNVNAFGADSTYSVKITPKGQTNVVYEKAVLIQGRASQLHSSREDKYYIWSEEPSLNAGNYTAEFTIKAKRVFRGTTQVKEDRLSFEFDSGGCVIRGSSCTKDEDCCGYETFDSLCGIQDVCVRFPECSSCSPICYVSGDPKTCVNPQPFCCETRIGKNNLLCPVLRDLIVY